MKEKQVVARLDSLDGLRFIAALSILLGHTFTPASAVNFGYGSITLHTLTIIGMPLFFVLSGFVITHKYYDYFAFGIKLPELKVFLSHRIARLAPLFYCTLLFLLIFTRPQLNMGLPDSWLHNILNSDGGVSYLIQWLLGIYTWTYVQLNGVAVINSPFGVAWSISTEFWFYLVFPFWVLILRYLKTTRQSICWSIVICTLAYVIYAFLYRYYDALAEHHVFGPAGITRGSSVWLESHFRWLAYVSPYAHIFEFLLGTIVARAYALSNKTETSRYSLVGLSILELTTFLVLVGVWSGWAVSVGEHGDYRDWVATNAFRPGHYFAFLHLNFLLAPLMALLIWISTQGVKTPLTKLASSRFFIFGGTLSYSIYLLHPLVVSIPRVASQSGPIRVVLAVVLTMLLASITYAAVEKPGRRLLLQLMKPKS